MGTSKKTYIDTRQKKEVKNALIVLRNLQNENVMNIQNMTAFLMGVQFASSRVENKEA